MKQPMTFTGNSRGTSRRNVLLICAVTTLNSYNYNDNNK